jgi:hypothetical protein
MFSDSTLIVNLLTSLYEKGEKMYTCEDVAKVVVVNVKRKKYTLTQEAQQTFADIHDSWEMNICKAYQHDILLSCKGKYR